MDNSSFEFVKHLWYCYSGLVKSCQGNTLIDKHNQNTMSLSVMYNIINTPQLASVDIELLFNSILLILINF